MTAQATIARQHPTSDQLREYLDGERCPECGELLESARGPRLCVDCGGTAAAATKEAAHG